MPMLLEKKKNLDNLRQKKTKVTAAHILRKKLEEWHQKEKENLTGNKMMKKPEESKARA